MSMLRRERQGQSVHSATSHPSLLLAPTLVTKQRILLRSFSASPVHQTTIIQRLKHRMHPPGRDPYRKSDTLALALDIVSQSYNSPSTRTYDTYQYLSQEIAP